MSSFSVKQLLLRVNLIFGSVSTVTLQQVVLQSLTNKPRCVKALECFWVSHDWLNLSFNEVETNINHRIT